MNILNYSIGTFSIGSILSAIVIFAICYIAIRAIMGIINKLLSKTQLNNTFAGFIGTTIKILLYFVAIIIVADILGIPVTSLIAVFSVAGLAISLSVQNSFSNIAGGLTILGTKPFVEGDYIETASIGGVVKEIGLFYTKISTPDNKLIYVPNTEISQSKITNYTAEKTRRIDINITASYDSEVSKVENALISSANAVDTILKEPAVFASVTEYGNSSISYVVRAWANTDDYWTAYFELLKNIKREFNKQGIEMTYDHVNVHLIKE